MTGIFLDDAKVASVSPIDKRSDNKNKTLNYRLVSALNCFSRKYKTVSKMQLVSFLGSQFFLFLCAYRDSYNTQHVLIRVLEEWRKTLDNNFLVAGVFMDLSKTFDCTSHDLLTAKLCGVLRGSIVDVFYLTHF